MTAGRVPLVVGEVEYAWHEIALGERASAGWAHHGIAVLPDGDVVAAAPDKASLVRFDTSGWQQSRVDTELTEMHGIRASADAARQLWVADNGQRAVPSRPSYTGVTNPGRVVALGLDGSVRQELLVPEIAAYEHSPWKPCAVAVDDRPADDRPADDRPADDRPADDRPADGGSLGGTGDVWVADGYGQSLLHRYSRDGRLLASFDGSASGKAFDTPHDVIIDRRRGLPELYVADRSNKRIVVLDLEGRFLRVVGEGVLSSPSGLATSGQLLFVAELHGRLAVLGAGDELVCYLAGSASHERPGWPNALDDQGNTVRVPDLAESAFNSPHGIATDSGGSVYVSEWLIGGRIVRLAPLG